MKTILIQSDVKGAGEFRNHLKTSLAEFNVIASIREAEVPFCH